MITAQMARTTATFFSPFLLSSGRDGDARRARLREKYRVEGERAQVLDGRSEQRSELPGRLKEVAVYSYPGHIGTPGPPGGRRGNTVPLVNDVDRPQPGHVVGALLAEHID